MVIKMSSESATGKRNGLNWRGSATLAGVLILVTALSVYGSAPVAGHGDDGLTQLSPNLSEFDALPGGLTPKITLLILQVALVIAMAKLCGALAERVKIPGVLGELGAGVLIGPFALGALILIPIHGHWLPLFPKPATPETWPISDELWLLAQIASIVLLFVTGLHTNLRQFVRYVGPATIIAIGGVITPFFLGAWATAYFSAGVFHTTLNWYSPQSLFVGAIMVATSVGITARVLSDIKKLDTPEGVTILGGAVIDDVLGILVLAIVSGLARTGHANFGDIAWIAIKAITFWLGLTGIGFLLADKIEHLFNSIKYAGARVALGLALCLLCSGAAELFGLAFIIGAYSIGLALSKTKMAHQLMEDLTPINDFIVPVFFAVMGMLVNFGTMTQAVGFGIVLCVLAIVSKVFGCGIPALGTGFNLTGAVRVGVGMLPRGEVALIMAGVGLAGGYINSSIFGVAILMTLVTTIVAPLLLVPAFKYGGSGRRRAREETTPIQPEKTVTLQMPQGLARMFARVLLNTAAAEGYQVDLDQAEQQIYLLQKDRRYIAINLADDQVIVHTAGENADQLNKILQAAERQMTETFDRIYPAEKYKL